MRKLFKTRAQVNVDEIEMIVSFKKKKRLAIYFKWKLKLCAHEIDLNAPESSH